MVVAQIFRGYTSIEMKLVYFDVCCLNRPFDDQTQVRIRLESEAVLLLLQAVQDGRLQMASSTAIEYENANNPDRQRHQAVLDLLRLATRTVEITDREERRARSLTNEGLGAYDALHVACAESVGADVLLTTDDGLQRWANRKLGKSLQVSNPVDWLREATI